MKKWILPAIAAVAVVAAVAVTVLQPGKDKSNETANASTAVATAAVSGGEYVLSASELSSDKVTFVRPVKDSKIELLARIGDDGAAKIALGTCQSCNGAPGAYYTQEGEILKCNNCGLTFPQNVLDQPGGGCHPIMIDESVYTVSDDSVTIDTDKLKEYEVLFTQVAEH